MGCSASAKSTTGATDKSLDATTAPAPEIHDKTTDDGDAASVAVARAPAPEEHGKIESLADGGDSKVVDSPEQEDHEAENICEMPDLDAASTLKVECKPLTTASSTEATASSTEAIAPPEQTTNSESVPLTVVSSENEVFKQDVKGTRLTRFGYSEYAKKSYTMLFGSKSKAPKIAPSDNCIILVKPAQGALSKDVVEGKLPEENPADCDVKTAAEASPEIAMLSTSNVNSSKGANDQGKGKGPSNRVLGFFTSRTNKKAQEQGESLEKEENPQSNEAPAVAA